MITMSYDAIPIENSTAQARGPYLRDAGRAGSRFVCHAGREWVSLIVAMPEQCLSRRRQHKRSFPFLRILCSRQYEIPQTAFLIRCI